MARFFQAGREFVAGAQTGICLNVDYERIAQVTGTDRLLLWSAAMTRRRRCAFVDIRVLSQIKGTVVTNRLRTGYWEGDVAADVREQALSFRVRGRMRGWAKMGPWTRPGSAIRVFYNWLAYAGSLPRRIDAPWTNFTGGNRATILELGFGSDGTNP
jgi:hypothetical protein